MAETPDAYTSRSSSSTLPTIQPPGVSSCNRLRVRRNVLLPQPDGPIRAWTRLGAKPSETFLTAVNLPYIALRPSVRSCGMASVTAGEPLASDNACRDAEQQHHQDQHQ